MDRRDALLLCVVIVIAAGARFYRLGDASIWLDESLTLRFAALPWDTLWISAYDPTPPLYYSVVKLIMGLGSQEFWLRAPSAVAGTATVALVYLATRRLAGTAAAFTAALLLALSVANIEYSQEARAYALAGFFIAASFLGFTRITDCWANMPDRTPVRVFLLRGGLLYTLATLAALYTHNTTLFYWLAIQCCFLAHLASMRDRHAALGQWFVANALIALAWLPWLTASFEIIESGRFGWLGQPDALSAAATWVETYGFLNDGPLAIVGNGLLFVLCAAGVVAAARRPPVAISLVALLAFSSLAVWTYGLVSTPVFMRRSILWGTIFMYMAVGVAVSRLSRPVAAALVAVLVLFGLIGVYAYNERNLAQNENWRAVAGKFSRLSEPGDLLMFRTTFAARPFLYYAQVAPDTRVLGVDCARSRELFGTIDQLSGVRYINWQQDRPPWDASDIPQRDIWVVDSMCRGDTLAESNAWLRTAWRKQKTYRSQGVRLHHWQPKQAEQRPDRAVKDTRQKR